MSGISTHVLDTSQGRPAAGVNVKLFCSDQEIGSGMTDKDGRVPALLPEDMKLAAGSYRILFEIGGYFADGFHPEVAIAFTVRDDQEHYHVPLLISPFGYTTYRGS